jgi:hypothetical protein
VKTLIKKILMVSLAAAAGQTVWADAPKAAPAKPVAARSTFVMPTNLREGRDPFFPESTRPFDAYKEVSHTADINAFSVKGISIQGGHSMAIINNHTFAVGDEGDVLTPTGRVHLRCTEIRAGVVVIEVNGIKRELNIGANGAK